jgi:hypothetical protein
VYCEYNAQCVKLKTGIESKEKKQKKKKKKKKKESRKKLQAENNKIEYRTRESVHCG